MNFHQEPSIILLMRKFTVNRNVNLFSQIQVRISFERFNILPLRIINKLLENWVKTTN